jgi:CTP synthase (UTP-ammonia lyase)
MTTPIRVGIIGDFNPQNSTHIATNDGIQHAAEFLGNSVETVWLPTDQPHNYGEFSALFCSPGSPYRSLEGALLGIRFAREYKIPFLGTCGGMQHLVLEYARNVLGFKEAAHAETDPYASCLFITPLSCSLAGKTMEVAIKPESTAARAYRATCSTESFYCNFGLNPQYQEQLQQAGLLISGTDQSGEARIAELPSHPFYVGTLFVPQVRSAPGNPHPLLLEFCRSAVLRVSAAGV